MELQLTPTDDGSLTLYRSDMDEHYHSTKGALTESQHVYIESGLRHRLREIGRSKEFRILEVGFGTGLDVVLTAQAIKDSDVKVHYIAIEKYPLDNTILNQLDFGPDIDADLFRAIHAAPWNKEVELFPGFVIEKRHADFLTDPLPGQIDVVYMDAFGPDKQPEMWTVEALERLTATMNPEAVLTTYSAKGSVRRALRDLGLTVERLPGPPGGKREILRGVKLFEP